MDETAPIGSTSTLEDAIKAYIEQHPGTSGTRANYESCLHRITHGFAAIPLNALVNQTDMICDALARYAASHSHGTNRVAQAAWKGLAKYIKEQTNLDIIWETPEEERRRLHRVDLRAAPRVLEVTTDEHHADGKQETKELPTNPQSPHLHILEDFTEETSLHAVFTTYRNVCYQNRLLSRGTMAVYASRINGILYTKVGNRRLGDAKLGDLVKDPETVRAALDTYMTRSDLSPSTIASAQSAWNSLVKYIKDRTGFNLPVESEEDEKNRLYRENLRREERAERRAAMRLERNKPEIPIEVAITVYKFQQFLIKSTPLGAVNERAITLETIASLPTGCIVRCREIYTVRIPGVMDMDVRADILDPILKVLYSWSYPDGRIGTGPLVKENPAGRKHATLEQIRFSLKTARQMGIDPDAVPAPRLIISEPAPTPPPLPPNPFNTVQ